MSKKVLSSWGVGLDYSHGLSGRKTFYTICPFFPGSNVFSVKFPQTEAFILKSLKISASLWGSLIEIIPQFHARHPLFSLLSMYVPLTEANTMMAYRSCILSV